MVNLLIYLYKYPSGYYIQQCCPLDSSSCCYSPGRMSTFRFFALFPGVSADLKSSGSLYVGFSRSIICCLKVFCTTLNYIRTKDAMIPYWNNKFFPGILNSSSDISKNKWPYGCGQYQFIFKGGLKLLLVVHRLNGFTTLSAIQDCVFASMFLVLCPAFKTC